MKTIAKGEKKSKRELNEQNHPVLDGTEDFDVRVAMIQALIPLGLAAVEEELEAEVTRLAGARYERSGRLPGHVRWTKQSGSIYLGDQKHPIRYQRVRDQTKGTEVVLKSYQRLQKPRGMDEGLIKRVLLGVSCGRYQEAAEVLPSAFGLSRSSISRRFIKATARKFAQLQERRLESLDLAAVFLDGKRFAEDGMVIAVGVKLSGEKIPLGIVQTATENERAISEFLEGLLTRGLKAAGLLWIIDGSKGMRAAIRRIAGKQAVIQRCRWHKRENIVSYLVKSRQAGVRREIDAAYRQPTYEAAKARLIQIQNGLKRENPSAAASLEEGMEETLTLHRLGVTGALATSFATTNVLESINAQLGRLTRNVTRWRNGDQKQRWVASALLDIEPRLRRVKGYRALPQLRAVILREQADEGASTGTGDAKIVDPGANVTAA